MSASAFGDRSSRVAGVLSNVSSENGGTARPGVTCIVNPGAPLATTATPAGLPVKTTKCVAVSARLPRTRFCLTAYRRGVSTWPAAASPSKAPSASATMALPWCKSSSIARMAFDCWPASARLAPTAPSNGAGQEARPSSSNTSRISRSPASAGLAPSAARPWPARSRHNAAMASVLPDRSTAWSAGQRFKRRSRTESRSKPRSASDTPSVSGDLEELIGAKVSASAAAVREDRLRA